MLQTSTHYVNELAIMMIINLKVEGIMEKAIKPCSICNGLCDVKTVFEPQKKYCVTCTVCGNETDPKPFSNALTVLYKMERR
jgi:hypothetical protein